MVHYRYVALAAGVLALACTDTPQEPSGIRPSFAVDEPVVLVGAGDIAGCTSAYKDEATAALLDTIPGTVFTLGDNAYPHGTATQFKNCYGTSWGRHRARTRPAIGNHEYRTGTGTGYHGYFGSRSAPEGLPYYSYNLGAWHIVVLDSERNIPDQAAWLEADLAANPRRCTLAYWHQPLFTSGNHLPSTRVRKLFSILYYARADVVLSAHNHSYERFAPQTPAGVLNLKRGITTFVVGTGGAPFQPLNAETPNLVVRQNRTHGVLKLKLYDTRYSWEFIPVAGQTFTDKGERNCH